MAEQHNLGGHWLDPGWVRRRLHLIGAEGATEGMLAPIKARRDPLARLRKDGTLDDNHLAAAGEIEDVFEALSVSYFPRRPHLGGRKIVVKGFPRQRLPASMLEPFDRYRPWAEETGAIRITPEVTVLGATLHAVVDGWRLRDIEKLCCKAQGHGFAGAMLKDSLDRYVEHAGW